MKKNGLNTCAECSKAIGTKGSRTFEIEHVAGTILIVVCATCLNAGAPGYSVDAVAAKVLAVLAADGFSVGTLDFAPGASFARRVTAPAVVA